MMDKKSANGFPSKAGEGGVQRKQLPYSVETPYGFHLDLDFLKYVDDIEKGNTIKRVHIQRRVKGPPKFSTLPRNFSLPGHGARPAPKEKDSAWSGTSTLGPKPKSRVTEVQQIFDFRPSDGGTPSRGTTSQGGGYVSVKPREEVGAGARGLEEKPVSLQARPNLLRASSMPITLQHRKGSDSSSPDRVVGTPENGSSENVFRASPDITDRRCVPQDRTGLHQQITVALKRVRELEEQVKTIPELKAQICSLREEREQLLLQLQVQTQAQASTLSSIPDSISDGGTHAQPQGGGLNSGLTALPKGVLEATACLSVEQAIQEDKQGVIQASGVSQTEREMRAESATSSLVQGELGGLSEKERERQTQPSEKSDRQRETLENQLQHAVKKLSQDIAVQELTSLNMAMKQIEGVSNVQGASAVEDGKIVCYHISSDEDLVSVQQLQDKLSALESKLTHASQELERTNSLLREQIEENKLKEERILQLSEGMRVEVCTTETESRPRRESIDRGTETERVGLANQETATESPGTVDQGTDTEKICIEVCVPSVRPRSVDHVPETEKVDTYDQLTEMGAEAAARPRANSMDQGTETEKVDTQDQMTETPVTDRVNQVTETEADMVTNHPLRPRASSVDQGTETERVDTVDRVTETVAAQRADQQTETEIERRTDNNPAREVGAESQVTESEGSQGADVQVVSETVQDKNDNERTARDNTGSQSVITKEVVTESSVAVTESVFKQSLVPGSVSQDEELTSQITATGESRDTVSEIKESAAESDSEAKTVVTEIVKTEQAALETVETQQTVIDSEIVSVTAKETVVTDSVVVAAENSAVKTAAPVRPQRGRKPTAEQSQPSQPQLQAPPVRPRRGSSETQPQSPQTQKKTQAQAQAQATSQPRVQTPPQSNSGGSSETQIKLSEPQTSPVQTPLKVEHHPPAQRLSEISSEDQPQVQTQAEPQVPSPGPSEKQTQPQTTETQPQTAGTRRGSKELQAPRRGSSESQPVGRGSGEAQSRTVRRGSSEAQFQGTRRGSGETPRRGSSESQPLRKGSSEAAKQHGSNEAQASRRESGETQPPRRGSSESPTSPAALGQVVTRLTGLLGEQWAQLGSSSGVQQTATQQDTPTPQKQTAGKRAGAGKGASAKPVGKPAPAAAAGKPSGKPGPSKMSSIQSQLVSSLSVLSAFYSPGQKAAAASKQQEQGLKSIMKKNGVADKQGNGGAKKNLKFVGVNGGYETTSSEESSGDEKTKVGVEEDSSEPEEGKEKALQPAEEPQEEAETQEMDREALPQEEQAVAEEKESEGDLQLPEDSQEEEAAGEQVDQGFIDACLYVKDRMEEVSSPDKEMRQVLLVLYQEWFRVSSQKSSQAETVTLYLRQVSLTTPTLLPYVVNLTDGNGNTALHYSVSHSNFPVVKLLLDTGLCETDNVNKAGYTAVMLAALTAADSPDDLEVALQLLRQGDVNARSSLAGQTALMLAVSHGRIAMVKLLLSCGADVNAQDRDSSTALMCACEHGHLHIARLLLETGRCDTSLTDKNGQTALAVAAAASHQDIFDLLKAHTEAKASEPPLPHTSTEPGQPH
ncbi:KN motif and ankyrin repeat domain-containing protein 4 [Myripristis murdjan]|uniref:KN motif and ankyrin repeat domain-containing protein 4 n=1 Tax=Myripristis murdjan TaxID=586833 RepID=UPI0011761CF9|nr:KN motif and ankyrin repeat domain-containing protein 4 [Myripristis murdjan]